MAERSERTGLTERAGDRLRVRLAQTRDARAIAVVGDAAWRAAYRGLMPDELIERCSVEARLARREQGDPKPRTWVVEHAGRVVAYSSAGRARDPDPPVTRGEIYSMYVHPDRWRHGCGRALLPHIMAELARKGFDEVVLWCLTDNALGRAFYERMGFTVELERVSKTLDGFELDHTRYRRALLAGPSPDSAIPK